MKNTEKIDWAACVNEEAFMNLSGNELNEMGFMLRNVKPKKKIIYFIDYLLNLNKEEFEKKLESISPEEKRELADYLLKQNKII